MKSGAQVDVPVSFSVPPLPDKLFFSIREASQICGVEPHVLRYWETEFRHIKPIKKNGNRRLYRQRDVIAILKIKHLLYNLKFTIKGAKKRLQEGDIHEIAGQDSFQAALDSLKNELCLIRGLLADQH